MSAKGAKIMASKRKIEVFSAGCPACEEAIVLVNRIACPSCAVEVLDMRDRAVAERATRYGVKSLPAVVVNGQLAECCKTKGIMEADLRSAGVGAA
jgi:glutaredoxin 3